MASVRNPISSYPPCARCKGLLLVLHAAIDKRSTLVPGPVAKGVSSAHKLWPARESRLVLITARTFHTHPSAGPDPGYRGMRGGKGKRNFSNWFE